MEEKVISIIAEELGRDEADITVDTTFEELDADSLDLFQVINTLEEEFEIEFDNDESANIKTVADVIECIKAAQE
ncbi:MAG: acyl carrier protein [Clostridia bacterium]|nr:acyl carrier protein [Clostridia bacterium]